MDALEQWDCQYSNPVFKWTKKEMPEIHNELSLCRLTVPEIRAGDGLNDDFFYRTSQALASL